MTQKIFGTIIAAIILAALTWFVSKTGKGIESELDDKIKAIIEKELAKIPNERKYRFDCVNPPANTERECNCPDNDFVVGVFHKDQERDGSDAEQVTALNCVSIKKGS
jgi:hypothetical protein